MSLAVLDSPSDPFYSREEELRFEKDVVDGAYGSPEDQVIIDLTVFDVERQVNAAHTLGKHAIKDPIFNMDLEVGATIQLQENDPYRRLGSLSLNTTN